ncbi:beta-lactamase/transpeptidase-like protein [Corynespora cassiicola Philippines]|uniref:Beta-lactamase/transpeptidase-like protein n=1 Tax=Corynespora cassiicola Philippines TaxID=1448308 RepID=A0A2T2N1H7_CORCC|nr:beta-lactamase/transpeptidase-like protein [Corynespora cassiicola Philippines]
MIALIEALLVWTGLLAVAARADCIPDAPEKLLADPLVLSHPAVTAAFEEVGRNLSALFVNTTRDGLSFAIVHASTPDKAYSFNHGALKLNETYDGNEITSDSIMRIASISKHFAMFSVLVAGSGARAQNATVPGLRLETPVREVLPEFGLPDKDWENGGKDITLGMLASHSAGLPREGYTTNFNMVTGFGKADADTIGSAWAETTPEGVIEITRKTKLMFAPGQRAGYSNAGISILASAVAAYYSKIKGSSMSWNDFAAQEILAPLNMTHTFTGRIPSSLTPDVGVPAFPHWADLLVGTGYDPAAGMWSSANDLTKYIHHIWLSPEPPFPLITLPQRRLTLKPNSALPDGTQLVGPGWEIDLFTIPTSPGSSTALSKTYAAYGKAGDAGGWHAWMDVVPNLGYGIVVLAQEAREEGFARIVPTAVRDAVHAILLPAFASAVAERTRQRFGGWYSNGRDGGVIAEQVPGAAAGNTTTYAKVEVEEQILYLRELVVNGTSALEGLDRLGWTEEEEGPRFWSTDVGVALTPAEGAAENEEFGPGAQVWRMMLPGLDKCDWWDFDGYTDQNGWPLSKVVLAETEGGVELRYPPYDVVLERIQTHKRYVSE